MDWKRILNKDDKLLTKFYEETPEIWVEISSKFFKLGKSKSRKQCRERWKNYDDPKVIQEKFSKEEMGKKYFNWLRKIIQSVQKSQVISEINQKMQ